MLHGTSLGTDGQWGTSLIYGANSHSGHALTHSLLVESEAVLDARNSLFGRAEVVQKSAEELVVATPARDHFNVGAVSLGYIREIARVGSGTLGVGAMGTINVVPSALSSAYGSRTPLGAMLIVRVRPYRTGMKMMGPM